MKRTTATPAALDTDRDGVIEITAREHGIALATHLLDPDRDKPMVVVSISPSASWAIDADSMYDAVTPLARVARIRNGPATYALAAGLPPGTAVYGTAGRVYATGTRWWSDPSCSILRIPRSPDQAAAAGEDLIEAAVAAGYTATKSRSCPSDETKALKAQIRELERVNIRLEYLLHRAAPTAPRPGQHRPGPVTDPDTRFRAEVAHQWEQRVAHPDPNSTPLPAGYPLTPGFLATLDPLTPTEYRKAASVAMEILTGLVHTIPGRRAHLLRTGTPGNNPPHRTSTGQLIWRANIQTNSPAARRIHWTRTPDGQIHLLAVTHHDQPIAA